MNSSFFRFFSIPFLFLLLFLTSICLFFIPLYSIYPESFGFSNTLSDSFITLGSDYVWPIPGYTKISSNFGKRVSPTLGASSFHKGIDIPAPEGTALYAITDGTIAFTGFLGGGGYTITLSSNSMKITYCHVSGNFIISVGDIIKKGTLIGYVGSMYVDNIPNNPYHDKNGRPTNGAITGCHLHLGIRIQDNYLDPLSLFLSAN